ncbi:MAG: hypothetical protein HRU40_03480 [Saprospiraceae bacterium]|nr:hypothetical protein [Saprospiraceae bacterium]
MIDYKRLMPMLIDKKMNPNQFMLLLLIYNREFELIYRFSNPTSDSGRWVTKKDIHNLIDRGYLRWMDSNEKRQYVPTEFEVTDKFIKDIYTDYPMEAALAFWNLYPSVIRIMGRNFPGKDLGEIMTKEEFLDSYVSHYARDTELHQKIMKGLRFALKNNSIHTTILSYLESEQYMVDYTNAEMDIFSYDPSEELNKSV